MAAKLNNANELNVADARRTNANCRERLDALEHWGITVEKLDKHEALIADVEKLMRSMPQKEVTARELKARLLDCVGDYRPAADLVANGFDGRNEDVAQELGCNVPVFPATEQRIRTFVTRLPAAIKKHGPALAANGFPKDKQAKLLDAVDAYRAAKASAPKERGKKKLATAERHAALAELEYTTSYLRRAARAALRHSAALVEFDRLKAYPKARKAQGGQQQPMPSMTAEVAKK